MRMYRRPVEKITIPVISEKKLLTWFEGVMKTVLTIIAIRSKPKTHR